MEQFVVVHNPAGMRNARSAGHLEAARDLLQYADAALGSSSGGHNLVSLYIGKHNRELWSRVLTSREVFDIRRLLMRWEHPADTQYLVEKHLEHVDLSRLKTLKTKIFIGIFNVRTAQTEYHQLTEDNAYFLLRATIAYPFYAPLVPWNGEIYADGGTGDPSPVGYAVNVLKAKKIIVFGAYPLGFLPRNHGRLSAWAAFRYPWQQKARQAVRDRTKKFREAQQLIISPPRGVEILYVGPPARAPLTTFSRDAHTVSREWLEGEQEFYPRWRPAVERFIGM